MSDRPYVRKKPYTHPNKGKGRGFQWLNAHKDYAGDDCLQWPFSTCNGYGTFGHLNKLLYAHRMMCEMVHGPSPGVGYHAAHSCGRGDKGCVNPRHIQWKTVSANQIDRTRHGTRNTGPRGKISREQRREIVSLRGKLKQREIAEIYGITRSRVGIIQNTYLKQANE